MNAQEREIKRAKDSIKKANSELAALEQMKLDALPLPHVCLVDSYKCDVSVNYEVSDFEELALVVEVFKPGIVPCVWFKDSCASIFPEELIDEKQQERLDEGRATMKPAFGVFSRHSAWGEAAQYQGGDIKIYSKVNEVMYNVTIKATHRAKFLDAPFNFSPRITRFPGGVRIADYNRRNPFACAGQFSTHFSGQPGVPDLQVMFAPDTEVEEILVAFDN